MGSTLISSARSFFPALVIALLISLALFFSHCQRYLEFTLAFPGTAWVHLYPSRGGEAGNLKYKGVRVESSGRPVKVRMPLLPVELDALVLRIDQPGGAVSIRDIRIVNALGDLLERIDGNQVENSAASTVETMEGGITLVPSGLSPIIDMRLHLAAATAGIPNGAGIFFLKMLIACLATLFALLAGVRYLTGWGGSSIPDWGAALGRSRQEWVPDNPWIAAVALFLVIFGCRLWLINGFGSDLPFWDQWNAEAQHLYLPHLNGTLSVGDLFAPHNEHRIMLTRLASLALLMLNGTWDPLLQMALNAALYAGVGLFLFRVMGVPSRLVWGGAVALLFSLPFGWQNTLGGFQLQMYLMVGLSLLFLWLMTCCTRRRAGWVGGVICAIALQFTMASGFLACAALLPVTLLEAARQGGAGQLRRLAPTLLLTVAAIAGGVLLKADVPIHAALHAASPWEWLTAFAVNLGWPLSLVPMFVVAPPGAGAGYCLAALLLWLPFTVLLWQYLKGQERSGVMTLVVAIGIWAVLQAAAAAYARGANIYPSSRYLDIFAIGLLVNVASLLILQYCPGKSRTGRMVAAIASPWVLGAASGLLFVTGMNLVHDLPEKGSQQQASLEHVQRFLASGDIGALSGKPKFDIPHPERDDLAKLLENPDIRRILPPTVGGSGSPGRLRPVLGPLLAYGPLVAAVGVIMIVVATIRRRWRGEGNLPGRS